MNFTTDAASCRIDFFMADGKWYCTEAIKMPYYWGNRDVDPKAAPLLLPEAALRALAEDRRFTLDGRPRYAGMWAVILEPHHQFAHPQMFKIPEVWP